MAASMTEQTLAIIKPDAIMAGKQAEILDMIGKNAFTLVSQDLVLLTPERAKAFYAEHDGKAFFEGLTDFMCSGPCLVLVLAKANGIKAWRALMGPTNSEVARASAPDSVRGLFGTDGRRNATHGSDSPLSAQREIKFFFPRLIVEPLPGVDAAKSKLTEAVVPILTTGLTELCRAKPQNPVEWLANWLLENNPNNPTDTTAADAKSRIVFVLGGPGSGKGTQSKLLKAEFRYEHVSVGDLLREEQAKPDSAEAAVILDCTTNGTLVPTSIVLTLLKRALDKKPGATFLVDGFPRSLEQVREFEQMIGAPTNVLFFDVSRDAMTARLLERGKTSGRADDNMESILKRFDTFSEQSMPVIELYEHQGKVNRINAELAIDEVFAATKSVFTK